MANQYTRRYTRQDIAAAEQMVEQGWCCKVTCERLGIPVATMRTWSRRYGWEWGKRGVVRSNGIPPDVLEQAKEMAGEGMSRNEVSRLLGVKYSTLTSAAQREGWNWPAAYNNGSASNAPSDCVDCEHPQRAECSQHHCACEKPIRVLNWPEDALWSQNGGRQAAEVAY